VVVTSGPGRRAGGRAVRWRLVGLALLMAMPPGASGARAASHSLHAGADRNAFENQGFDPAQTQFNASLSYGAMSLIAPTIFGDFQAPTQVAYPSFTWRGPVTSANVGSDPATSIMLSNVLERDLLTSITAMMADAFGLGPALPDPSATTPQSGMASFSINDHAAASPTTGGRGSDLSCGTQVPNELQTGGEFWNAQAASPPPVQFAKGVFVGDELGNPLGDLGPTGNPTNLTRPGPAGAWCSPDYTPFSMSGPLESDALWILFSILLAALLVAWLSRGYRLPAA
jgi:hypothetical protein